MPIPQQIGIYTIEARLGESRLVQAYKASDPALKRTVALKVLPVEALPGGVPAPVFLERARPAIELIHPHLAWLWEAGEADGMCFLAERFVEGLPLADWQPESGIEEWRQVETIVQQVAQGLEFAHSRGLAHGDIRPGNILVAAELRAVLTDFGTALAFRESLTSAQYRAPELALGGPASPASDQYALACIQLEILIGEKIPQEVDQNEIFAWIQNKLAMLESLPAPVPWQVIPALRRALAFDPDQRFATVGEFAREPSRLAAAGGKEQLHYQAAAESQRLAEEAARLQAEEASRLEALERARLELEQDLRAASSGVVTGALPELPGELEDKPSPGAAVVPPAPRRRQHLPPRSFRWALAALLLVVLLLMGVWVSRRLPWQAIFPPTASSTPAPSATSSSTSTAPASLTPSATLSPAPSATRSHTPTQTLSATATLSPSPSLSPTPSLTATGTPRDDSDRESRRQSTGGP